MILRARWGRPWLLCLGLLSGACCAATHEVLNLDAARSQANFEVKVLWLVGLHGDFGAVRGTLAIDRFRSTVVVDASIDTNDLHMRSQNYEHWARSTEFFDAQRYPQIHFVSDAFPMVRLITGGDIAGTLTLRGNVRQVRFELDPAQCGNPLTGQCPVTARGTIQRGDFGMRSRRGTLSDKVELSFSIYVHRLAQTQP